MLVALNGRWLGSETLRFIYSARFGLSLLTFAVALTAVWTFRKKKNIVGAWVLGGLFLFLLVGILWLASAVIGSVFVESTAITR